MTARAPKAAPPREDTRTIRLTPDYLEHAEQARKLIGEVSATGVVRALLVWAPDAPVEMLNAIAKVAQEIRDAAEKPAPAPSKRARKSKKS